MYIFIGIHGNSWKTYENYLKKECEKNSLKINFLDFPTEERCTYEEWESMMDMMDKYLSDNLINEGTIVVSRCLGSRFVVKYTAKKKIKLKGFICIATSFEDYMPKDEMKATWKSFHVTVEEMEAIPSYIKYRYSIYGDCDHLFSKEVLEKSSEYIYAKKIFVKDMNHCGNLSGVKKIPYVMDIINKIR